MNKDGLNILIKEILEESYSKISAKDLLQLYNLEHLRHKGEYLDVFEKLVKRRQVPLNLNLSFFKSIKLVPWE